MMNFLSLVGAVTAGIVVSLNPFQATATQETAATAAVQTQPAAAATAQVGAQAATTTPVVTTTPAPSTSPAPQAAPATTQPATTGTTVGAQGETAATVEIEAILPSVSADTNLEGTILHTLHIGL